MRADGSVIIDTSLNTDQTEKDLKRLTKRIQTLEDQIFIKQKQKLPFVEQSKQLAAHLDEAKAKLDSMQNSSERWYTKVQIKEQGEAVKRLQREWDGVQNRVDGYDAAIHKARLEIDLSKERAGALHEKMLSAGTGSEKMAEATKKAHKNMSKFSLRLKEVVRSALIFTVISQSLAALREWSVRVIKTNEGAVAAIARLKAALLTLMQPLVAVVIPTFTALVDLLAKITFMAAQIVSGLFGTTAKESADAAENLHEETEALGGVEDAAKEASKALAGFDEINQLSFGGTSKDSGQTNHDDKISPDFSGIEDQDTNWLSDTLGKAAGWVAAALMLGGIALVAIGAAIGSLPTVLAGLVLLGAGVGIGSATGVLESWAETLGLNSVQEFVVLALLLGGIAIVAIGAAMGNIIMVIAGLVLIGATILYAANSGMLQDWAETLGLSKAARWITAALLIGGMTLIVIGAITKDILMVLAGLGLLAAGIYIGTKSGVLKEWTEALGLESVFDHVVAAMQLAGMAFIAIGAAMGNIFMIIAGVILLVAGFVAEQVGEETLMDWWEKLKLTNVQQWVSVALLLVGIALIAIGAISGNILMVLSGATLLALGIVVATQNRNLEDWVKVLGLEKIVGWVTTVLLLAGIAFIVFGILTTNILMIIAGIGFLAAGYVIGMSSGITKKWWDVLGLTEVESWVTAALLLAGIAMIAIGAMTANPLFILIGLGLLGAGAIYGLVNSSIGAGKKGHSSTAIGKGLSASSRALSLPSIPALARGAVIPPNSEFLAVLGDQKQGTNIEAPEGLIRRIVREEAGGLGGSKEITLRLVQDRGLVRYLKVELDAEAERQGVKLVKVGGVQ